MRERLAVADVPEPFKGSAIGMITAGLMSLAFMGFEVEQADDLETYAGRLDAADIPVSWGSRELADRIGPCWGLGSGIQGDPGPWVGELRNMWKPTVHPALWFHGGNLALSRFYSKFVAMQLKARQVGIETPVYGRPTPAQAGL